MRCEGWRRYGGIMTLGPVRWEQCHNEAIVLLTVIQDDEQSTLPGCDTCWKEAISTGIKIVEVKPITYDAGKE